MQLVKQRRTPKALSATLYSYVEPTNAKYAKTEGKKLFGSFSAYVNALIAKDRGVKPILGFWKAPGEAAKNYAQTAPKKRTTTVKRRKALKK